MLPTPQGGQHLEFSRHRSALPIFEICVSVSYSMESLYLAAFTWHLICEVLLYVGVVYPQYMLLLFFSSVCGLSP